MVEAFEALSKVAKGSGFALVLDVAVIYHGNDHGGVIGILQFRTGRNAAGGEVEGASAGCFFDVLSKLLVHYLMALGFDFLESVHRARNLGDALEKFVGSLFGHLVEFLHAGLAVKLVNGAEFWIQLVYQLVEFLVGEGLVHFVDGVGAEGVRDGLGAIELFKSCFEVCSVADFDILREGRVRQDIYAASVFHDSLLAYVFKI